MSVFETYTIGPFFRDSNEVDREEETTSRVAEWVSFPSAKRGGIEKNARKATNAIVFAMGPYPDLVDSLPQFSAEPHPSLNRLHLTDEQMLFG